jgi:hypothetical protein
MSRRTDNPFATPADHAADSAASAGASSDPWGQYRSTGGYFSHDQEQHADAHEEQSESQAHFQHSGSRHDDHFDQSEVPGTIRIKCTNCGQTFAMEEMDYHSKVRGFPRPAAMRSCVHVGAALLLFERGGVRGGAAGSQDQCGAAGCARPVHQGAVVPGVAGLGSSLGACV